MPIIQLKKNPSPIWRGICRLWQNVDKGVRWIIGNGNLIRAWHDKWLEGEGPLIDKEKKDILEDLRNAKIIDLVSEDGSWKWDTFQEFLPASLLIKIAAVCLPSKGSGS